MSMEYIEMCLELADNSTCGKKKYGSVIVKNGEIIGKGYNHPIREVEEELCHPCIREKINSGTRLEACAAVHAEQAAIIDSYKNKKDPEGAALYVAGKNADGETMVLDEKGFYCSFCSRIMAEAGIKEVGVLTKKGVEYLNRDEYLHSSFEFALEKKTVK